MCVMLLALPKVFEISFIAEKLPRKVIIKIPGSSEISELSEQNQ